jgi:N-methylhydantoinase B
MSAINPISMETVKNRLIAIGKEMVTTMVRTAGSPLYSEIKDFSCGLFDYQGRQVVYSGLTIVHNLMIHNLVQTSIRLHGTDPGIFDGDVFMGNDPYCGGGIHAAELGLVSPIFMDGEIVAWSGSIAHQLDIGGMSPGGFCPDAVDCYQEGIRFPPVKLYDRGELRKDIWAIHRNNVRLPEKISMELKGQIAANNVAKERIRELATRYGLETFRGTCDALIGLSARVTEERIRQLPEGRYEHVDFEEIEGIGDGLLQINCDLTIRDGKLIFDFRRDCPPQVQRPLNARNVLVKGELCTSLMPVLCHDIPWNEGCTYPIEVVTEPGTILDARPPAPCSCPFAACRANSAGMGAFNKALVHSPLRERLSANWQGCPTILVGVAEGEPGGPPEIILMADGMGGGGGAFSGKDGLEVCSLLSIMELSIGDVETQENAYPILYLTRQLHTDSGGPGRYRGGVGNLTAVMPYKTNGVQFMLVEDRRLVPDHGAMGGYPGASQLAWVGRDVNVEELIGKGFDGIDQITSKFELVPPISTVGLGPRDAFVFVAAAGGGYGDPLDRDPHKVTRDIQWHLVSRRQAKDVYGVQLKADSLEVDEAATIAERQRMKKARPTPRNVPQADTASGSGDYVVIKKTNGGGEISCSCCDAILSPVEQNWKDRVLVDEAPMDQLGLRIPAHERVVLRKYFCPNCQKLLDTEVTLRDLRPQWDYRPLD